MTQITNVRPQLGFGEAIASAFKKYATFTGRARRSEYWWFQLFALLMSLLSLIPILGWIITVAMILPSLAIEVRRLHDIGRSGWWLLGPLCFGLVGGLLLFIGAAAGLGGHGSGGGFTAVIGGILLFASIVCSIVLFVWSLFDSKPETNQYGPSPKYEIADEDEGLNVNSVVKEEPAPVSKPTEDEPAPVAEEEPAPTIKEEPAPTVEEEPQPTETEETKPTTSEDA